MTDREIIENAKRNHIIEAHCDTQTSFIIYHTESDENVAFVAFKDDEETLIFQHCICERLSVAIAQMSVHFQVEYAS